MSVMTDSELRIFEKEQVNCADVERLLGDYVDGELSPCLKGRISAHICSCERCKESETGYRQVISLAKELRLQTAGELSLEIRNRLRQNLNLRLGICLPEVKAIEE